MNSSNVLAHRSSAARSFLMLLPLLILAACDPGQLKEGLAPDDSEVAVVEVTPESPVVTVGQVVVVHAIALTTNGQPAPVEVDWSADGGTLAAVTDSSTQFSAALAGSYWIRGRHRRGSRPQDSTTITVTNPTPVLQAVILTPPSAALTTGAAQQFSVSGQWSNGATTAPAVIFNATGGTITSGGLYTAGTSAGTYRVVATHVGGTLADTAIVVLTVAPPVLQAVILTPASASLATGAAQQFSVSGQWSNGATTAPSVTYSATGGTISSGGLYTAGSTAGTFRVIAVQQGGTLADTSVVTLSTTPPVLQAVILTPASASLNTGATQQFSVSGQWSNGATTAPSVTYSATGGTVTSGGLYTAGSTAGAFRVIAVQQGGTLADTSTVTLTAAPPVLQAVILTPPSASLATGAAQQFSVSGQWSNGATTAPSVTYSATGGTISSGGLYTAGSTAGTFRVIAVQQGGPLADTSTVTLTATPPVLQAVILTPASASLATGATRQFSVSGQWSNGATTAPSVTYSATGGTISSGGLYTAGNTAGTFRVIAVHQGGTLADTSAVTLTAPVLQAIILTPASTSVATGATRQFNVSGQWSNGATTAPPVSYNSTGGTISSGGLYSAGSSAGTFRVIAVQQGGTLADTATLTLTTGSANNMYFNSSEPGGDGSNSNYLLADDFEDGDWYSKDCDQANGSGGLLQTDGWCGTIYANPITPSGAAVCGGAGFRGTNCAASGGYHSGSIGGRNMADHGFAGGVTNLNEAYFRLYFQPQSDYVGGHEKMFDFTRGVGTGAMVALCYNYFGSGNIKCIPYLHQDDGVQGQSNGWMGSNMASEITMVPTHWYYIEMRVKLNTPGSYNGTFEWWMNDCGVSGTACTGTPTLRGRYTNVLYRNSAESSVTLGGIWIENWANAATRGTMYYDNVIAAKAPIGFAP
jgi:hypothetical protein